MRRITPSLWAAGSNRSARDPSSSEQIRTVSSHTSVMFTLIWMKWLSTPVQGGTRRGGPGAAPTHSIRANWWAVDLWGLHVSSDEGTCLVLGSCWESKIAEEMMEVPPLKRGLPGLLGSDSIRKWHHILCDTVTGQAFLSFDQNLDIRLLQA